MVKALSAVRAGGPEVLELSDVEEHFAKKVRCNLRLSVPQGDLELGL